MSWLSLENLNKRAFKAGQRAATAIGGHILDASDPARRSQPTSVEEALVTTIDAALSVHIIHSNVSKAVERVFHTVQGHQDESGHKCIQFDGVIDIIAPVAKELNLPVEVFTGIENEIQMFDFNGDGLLDLQEVKRLFKKILQKRRQEFGGRRKPVKVPTMSVEEAGYTVVKELGRGGQGAMYLCTKVAWFQSQRYCIKFYSKQDANAGGLEELLDEYELMVNLDNPYIAKTYEVFQDSKFYYLVNEPYFGGDFTKLGKMAFDEGVKMTEAWWRPIFKQCLQGLAYLHSQGIIHCDIKEPNIMVASGDSYRAPRPVLIDFGLSASFLGGNRGVCGTPGYIPPETWQSGAWFPRGDTFSLGITFFQLLTGRVPSKNGTVVGVLQGSRDFAGVARQMALPWDTFPSSMRGLSELIKMMTMRERSDRPKPHQALQDPWFSSTSDGELPRATIRGLVGAAAAEGAREKLQEQLTAANQLADLHTMVEKLQQADPNNTGVVDAAVAAKVFTEHGVDADVVRKTLAPAVGAQVTFGNGVSQKSGAPSATFGYAALAQEVVEARHQFDYKYVQELFDRLDTDKSGTLSLQELQRLLCSKAFDIPSDRIGQVLEMMDVDRDGVVSFEEFSRAVLEYGRVVNRAEAAGGSVPTGNGLFALFTGGAGGSSSQPAGAGGRRSAVPSGMASKRGKASLPPSEALGLVNHSTFSQRHQRSRNRQRNSGPDVNLSTEYDMYSGSSSSSGSSSPRHWADAVRVGSRVAGSRPSGRSGRRRRRRELRAQSGGRSPMAMTASRSGGSLPERRMPDIFPLRIAVIAASGLGDAEPFSECHPFITCGFSSAHSAAFQTPVIQNCGSPVWNFEQEINAYTAGDTIDFAVLCAGPPAPGRALVGSPVGGEDNLIGIASICCERFYPRGFEGDLTILGSGCGIRGMLRVRLIPLVGDFGDQTPPIGPGAWYGNCARGLPYAEDDFAPLTPSSSTSREVKVTWGRSWTERRPAVTVATSPVHVSAPTYAYSPLSVVAPPSAAVISPATQCFATALPASIGYPGVPIGPFSGMNVDCIQRPLNQGLRANPFLPLA